MDSGAFQELERYGAYRHSAEEYADEINRLAALNPGLAAAVSQDWMCETWMLEKTGLSVAEHQARTIERYDVIRAGVHGVYVMPVLQGYQPAEYARHVAEYGSRLAVGAHVGVGSVCKRNADPTAVAAVLIAIRRERPDLRLHGFGVKITALRYSVVRDNLATADSMAWSYSARKQGRDGNDWKEAAAFVRKIERMPVQTGWEF